MLAKGLPRLNKTPITITITIILKRINMGIAM